MVTVYSKPQCVQCVATYRMLDKKGIEYTVVDITTNGEAYEYVISLGYSSAPVVHTGTEHWSGFRHDKLATLTPTTTTPAARVNA